MSAGLRFVVAAILAVLLAGCWRGDAPSRPSSKPPAPVSNEQPVPKAAAQAASAMPTAPTTGDEAGAANAAPAEPAKPSADGEASSNDSAATRAETDSQLQSSAERIVLLTPGGPLIVEIRMSIDGKPHGEGLRALLADVLASGDTDKDGRSTWKELTSDRASFEKQMTNAPAADSRQLKTLIDRYDENRDGAIQPAEAAAWLGRDGGVPAKAFSIRSAQSYRAAPTASSQIWQLLNVNRDGRLDREEIEGAAGLLLSFDSDDDRVLVPGEMASLREQLDAASDRRPYLSRANSYYAVMHLEPDTEIERLYYLLSDLYAPQQELSRASFPELPGLFAALDADGDETLDSSEMASILTIEPHLKVNIEFASAGERGADRATVQVTEMTPEVRVAENSSADRTVLELGPDRIILSAHNLATAGGSEQTSAQAAMQQQVRLMVHDQIDAVFHELDGNADGRLGEREIATSPTRLARCDRNGDGLLTADEIPYSMLAAFLLAEAANERSFYVPPSAPASGESNAPDWFGHADLNGDGEVSRREFLGSAAHFEKLDGNGDGFIGRVEASR